jgi:hypothetical protein
MADEAVAGNDQQDESQAGEDQQANDESQKQPEPTKIRYSDKDWTPEELVEELDNTNRAYKRLEQQQGAPEAPEPDTATDDGSDEYSQYGLTKEQVTTLRKVTGADELQKKLSDYEKRENDRQKAEENKQWDDGFKAVAEKYKDADVPLPTTPAQKEKLVRFMDESRIYDPVVAFREMHGSRLEPKKEEKPKAAVSDRSDTTQPSDNEAYKKALKAAAGDMEKISQVEAQFKGNPGA